MALRVRQILFVAPAPIVWGSHLGAFEAAGLALETTATLSSDQIGNGLAQGAWDVGIGVMDNVIGWGEAHGRDLRIIAQLEARQSMALVARPGCDDLADAARWRIGVDATTHGFVLVLYRALARAGVERGLCRFDPVGGVRQRFEALTDGRIDATILVPPFIDRAVDAGLQVLWRERDIAPDYPGVVATATVDWLQARPAAAAAYVGVLRRAAEWGCDPRHRDAAQAALIAAGHSPQAAARQTAAPVPGLRASRAGWDETVALRTEAGLVRQPLPTFARVTAWPRHRDGA